MIITAPYHWNVKKYYPALILDKPGFDNDERGLWLDVMIHGFYEGDTVPRIRFNAASYDYGMNLEIYDPNEAREVAHALNEAADLLDFQLKGQLEFLQVAD